MDGRWADDPIEQIKLTNGPVHKSKSLASFPLRAWHPLPLHLEMVKQREGGEMMFFFFLTNLVWEETGLALWLAGADAAFGGLYPVQI